MQENPLTTLPESSLGVDFIVTGPDGALWFTGTQIGRITPSGKISEFPLPSSSNGGDITAGPDDALWFTEFGSNKIGRLA